MPKRPLQRLENNAIVHTEKVNVLKSITCPCKTNILLDELDFVNEGVGSKTSKDFKCKKCGQDYNITDGGFSYVKCAISHNGDK